MRQSQRLSRGAFVAGTSLFAATAGRAFAQTPPTALRIGVTPSDGFGGEVFYANDMGFFTDAGIAPTVTPFQGEAPIVDAIISGSLDVGVSGAMTIANAYVRGIQVGYIAGAAVYSSAMPTLAFIVAKDSHLRSAKEFEGKTVAVDGLKSTIDLATVAWLARNGVDVSKVKTIELPRSEMAPALKRGTIDGAVLGEPFLSAALLTTARIFGKCFDVFGDHALLGGFFTSPEYARANAPLLRRFNGAIYRSARWANENHERSGLILQKYTHVSDTTLKEMTRVAYATSFEPQKLQLALDVAYQERFIARPVSYRDLVLNV